MPVTIKILQTGEVRLRPAAFTQPATRSVFMRRLRFLTDRTWMKEAVPIYTFLITHPSGTILFDAGLSPHCNDSNYLPFWNPTLKMVSQMTISSDQGIASLLEKEGVEKGDLKKVVLSHLHHDHSGGLKDLDAAGAEIFTSREHWEVFKNPIKATIEGALPSLWPDKFQPSFLEAKTEKLGPWERYYPITADGKIVAVDTPGHVPGHISLIVFMDAEKEGEEGKVYFLTGDATYNVESLEKEVTDGVNDDPVRAVESVRKIKEFARERDVVILPSHDWGSVKRLAEGTVYKPTKL